jgi:hypothetical protein
MRFLTQKHEYLTFLWPYFDCSNTKVSSSIYSQVWEHERTLKATPQEENGREVASEMHPMKN